MSSALAGSVTQIDPVLGRAVRSVAIGGRPRALAVVGDEVWVTVRPAATVDRRGGTLRVDSWKQPSIDPSLLWPEAPFQLWECTYDTLVTYQRAGGSEGSMLVPDLAVSVPLPAAGAMTYTFVLRPGLRYSDGSPVRAADFRYAIERTLQLNDKGAGSFLQEIVGAPACAGRSRPCHLSEGIIVDEATRTVTFHLLEPDPDFLYKLTLPCASPVPSTTPRADVGTHPVPSRTWLPSCPSRTCARSRSCPAGCPTTSTPRSGGSFWISCGLSTSRPPRRRPPLGRQLLAVGPRWYCPCMRRVPFTGGEKESLYVSLDRHRDVVLWKLEGLDDEQVRRPMVPSGTSLLGLVKHLASVEYGWFCETFGRPAEAVPFDPFDPDDPEADMRAAPHETTADIVSFYGRARAAADAVIRELELDDVGTSWSGATVSMRWVLIHMVEETARHAGHLDIVRELLDGATGDHPEAGR